MICSVRVFCIALFMIWMIKKNVTKGIVHPNINILSSFTQRDWRPEKESLVLKCLTQSSERALYDGIHKNIIQLAS